MNLLVKKALKFAIKAHKGQTYGGGEFIEHPIEVESIVCLLFPLDHNLQCAAFLHDVLEDTEITYEKLKKEFNEDIADLVKEVTKTDYNTFPSLHSQRGICLKFVDRLANLSNMKSWPEEKVQKYIKKSTFWKS